MRFRMQFEEGLYIYTHNIPMRFRMQFEEGFYICHNIDIFVVIINFVFK